MHCIATQPDVLPEQNDDDEGDGLQDLPNRQVHNTFIYRSVCLSIYLACFYLSICVSIYLSIYRVSSIYPSIYLSLDG